MADTLCGPSNALQNFQKHTSTDKTLQQDRLISRQTPVPYFRSQGPNAGILDAEFEAFQAGQPFNLERFDPEQELRHGASSSARFEPATPITSGWAADFQKLHLNEVQAAPIPLSHFQHEVSKPFTGSNEWHQDFLRRQEPVQDSFSSQPGVATFQEYTNQSNSLYGLQRPYNTFSTDHFHQQPERQVEEPSDDVAFQRAFDAAGLQVEKSMHEIEKVIDVEKSPVLRQNGFDAVGEHRIGADRILDESQQRKDHGQKETEADDLARTAGQLLENVKHEQNTKFRESSFLALMRQLRDKEVVIEGDQIVDSKQSLHPGGPNYPGEIEEPSVTEGLIHSPRPRTKTRSISVPRRRGNGFFEEDMRRQFRD